MSLLTVAYLGAAILFILSLGGLSTQESARRGNWYGIIGMINFAHGDIFMVGAFIALISFILFALTSIALPIVLLLTLLIAMVFTACYGWTVEKLA